MKQKLLGTGLSGLVGTRLMELLKDDFDFEILDLSQGIDITNREQIFSLINQSEAKSLVHLAAFTDVSRAYQEKGNKDGLVYKVNVLGTKNIAEACQQFNKYLIHISTDFVFDGKNPSAGGYIEDDQRSPIEWYGQTKAWAEEEVEKSGAKYSILRIAFPFRAQFKPKQDLIRKIIQGIKDKTLYPQWDDILITPTFIDDICQAVRLTLEKRPKGIYHCVGSTTLSPYQLAQEIAKIFKLDKGQIKKGSFKEYLKTDSRPRQQFMALNNQKIEKELGFQFHTLQESLRIMRQQLN